MSKPDRDTQTDTTKPPLEESDRLPRSTRQRKPVGTTSYIIDSSESEHRDYTLRMIFKSDGSIGFESSFSDYGAEFDDGHPGPESDSHSTTWISSAVAERLYERYLPRPTTRTAELERRAALAKAVEEANKDGGISRVLEEVNYVPPAS